MHIRKISLLILCSLSLFGCQQEDNAQLEQEEQARNDRILQVEQSNETEAEEKNNSEIAHHLANIANRVPEVNEASALVAGPYAVVAIDVNKDIDRTRVGSIKYSVSEALYHDPYGKTAIVIADGDIMARINGMGDKMQQGYPVQGVIDELAAIVGRYMPEFPVDDEQPVEPDDNKQMLPEDEEQKLEDIEKEQSNDKLD